MDGKPNETHKRKRENEVKKWTEEDIKQVLDYMQVHRNVEKPTAQLYYKKLLKETKIDATWNTLKCKVRYLKGSLHKADEWSRSTGAGVEDGDGSITIKDKILKICPHYEQLYDIFSKTKEIEVVVMDTSTDSFDISVNNVTDIEDDLIEVIDEPTTSSEATGFSEKVKRKARNICIDRLATMESERMKYRERQLKLETEKFEWAKEVERKKLEMEKQKIEYEFELKKLDLELKYKNK